MAGRAIRVCVCVCVILCTEFRILSEPTHEPQRALDGRRCLWCVCPLKRSLYSIETGDFKPFSPPAHWGECRKQLEKQIVTDRLSPSPLALTHDWTFAWMDAFLFSVAVEKHQDRGYFANLNRRCQGSRACILVRSKLLKRDRG